MKERKKSDMNPRDKDEDKVFEFESFPHTLCVSIFLICVYVLFSNDWILDTGLTTARRNHETEKEKELEKSCQHVLILSDSS